MEKRVIIAVVLSFLVLYLYQAMFVPPPKPPDKAQQPQAQTATASQAGGSGARSGEEPAAGAANSANAQTASASPAPASLAPVTTLVAAPSEQDIVVDTPTVRAVFTNRGAVLKNWRLKRYTDDKKTPVDLVPQTLRGATRPFSLDTGSEAVDARLNTALFRVDGYGATADPRTHVRLLRFEYRDASGLAARKTFTIDPVNYTVVATIDVTVNGQPANVAIVMGPGPGDVEGSVANQYLQKAEGILSRAGSVERLDAKTIMNRPISEGTLSWAGVDDHYFLSTALLGTVDAKDSPGRADGVAGQAVPNTRIAYTTLSVPDGNGKGTHDFVSYAVNPAGAGARLRFFIGPKDFDLLRSVQPDMVRAINFGMFAPIIVPLLRALNGINDYLGNYGWSIIALTFFINLLIFPLRHKSVVSMRKMQELQPEIKAIQERYGKLKATDPEKQKMNAELMGLYKQRGVNPASGCVPMLLTMPVLFAFYSLLSQAIELRGAPFALWITDLSVHDPWYVTPVLMGVTQLVQQKMTPSTADPVQQKMFMFMPIVFTGMFLWAPSGLVIYWFFSNLLAIGQQVITNKIIGPTAVRVIRPSAERQTKKLQDRSPKTPPLLRG